MKTIEELQDLINNLNFDLNDFEHKHKGKDIELEDLQKLNESLSLENPMTYLIYIQMNKDKLTRKELEMYKLAYNLQAKLDKKKMQMQYPQFFEQ